MTSRRTCACGAPARSSSLLAECVSCYVQRRNRELKALGWELLPSHLLTGRVRLALKNARIDVELLTHENFLEHPYAEEEMVAAAEVGDEVVFHSAYLAEGCADLMKSGWAPTWVVLLVKTALIRVTPTPVLEAALRRARDDQEYQHAIEAAYRLDGHAGVRTLALTVDGV